MAKVHFCFAEEKKSVDGLAHKYIEYKKSRIQSRMLLQHNDSGLEKVVMSAFAALVKSMAERAFAMPHIKCVSRKLRDLNSISL